MLRKPEAGIKDQRPTSVICHLLIMLNIRSFYIKNYKKGEDGFMFSVLTGLEILAKFYF